MRIVRSEDGPALAIRFRQRQLQLGAHDFEFALSGFDLSEEHHARLIPLCVACVQIELHLGPIGAEFHLRALLIDLL